MRSGLSARRGSARGGGTVGGKTPETVLLRSITLAPIVAEEAGWKLRFLRGGDLDSCVSERGARGQVGSGVKGAGGGRLVVSGGGAVRREKELGMRRSRSGLELGMMVLMMALAGLAGLAERSTLACLVGGRAGVGRGRRAGGAVGDVASVAEGARMAGRDGAGACTTSGDWRRGGGIDSGRVRGVGSGRRDGPAMWIGTAGAYDSDDTSPSCPNGAWLVYWNPTDCPRPYIRRLSCSTCTTLCSAGRANVRCSSYAIVR